VGRGCGRVLPSLHRTTPCLHQAQLMKYQVQPSSIGATEEAIQATGMGVLPEQFWKALEPQAPELSKWHAWCWSFPPPPPPVPPASGCSAQWGVFGTAAAAA
jgi:hypothetical protein